MDEKEEREGRIRRGASGPGSTFLHQNIVVRVPRLRGRTQGSQSGSRYEREGKTHAAGFGWCWRGWPGLRDGLRERRVQRRYLLSGGRV